MPLPEVYSNNSQSFDGLIVSDDLGCLIAEAPDDVSIRYVNPLAPIEPAGLAVSR